jgi:uncharacterized protein YqjF (DUF2071 family)
MIKAALKDVLTRRELLQFGVHSAIGGVFAGGCSLVDPTLTAEVSHRPWPLPQTRWVLAMRWHDLLFLHWPIRPELVRPLIPSALELDTFDGWCWIAVVPFHMTGVRPRYLPVSLAFPELNVRTYVKTPGRSGVWFFSLDAASWISVRAARWLGLPYYDARMTVRLDADVVHYQSLREHNKPAPIEFNASYKPTAPEYHAAPGSLDHWLTERYCLYGARKPGHVVYGEIHHPQWRLQPAEVEVRANSMTQPIGLQLPDSKPISHFARYQEVVAWPIVPLETT